MTYRHRGTDSQGQKFSQEIINKAWEKACEKMNNHEFIEHAFKFFSKKFKEGTYCLDDYGHIISKDEYGLKTKHGWEIDHIYPVSKKSHYGNGADNIDEFSNLRSLHWESNKRKGRLDPASYELEWEWVILHKSKAA